jgi:transposase-like protein
MTDFKGHRFEPDIILLCVRPYLACPLNYRHVEEMMAERGGRLII